MANSPKPLYWDTDVFIHRIQRTPQHIHILEQITDAAERSEIVFVQSTFTIAELIRVSGDEKLSEQQEDLIQAFFENEFVITRTLTEPIAFLSRKISREFGVKPGDAVHIATAIFWEVPILHTYDEKLLKKTKLIGDPPLIIEQPSFVGQLLLPNLELPVTAVETFLADRVASEPIVTKTSSLSEGNEKTIIEQANATTENREKQLNEGFNNLNRS